MYDTKRVRIEGGPLARTSVLNVHPAATGYGWRGSPGRAPELVIALRLPDETADSSLKRVNDELGVTMARFVSEATTERCREVECADARSGGYYVVAPGEDS